MTESKDIETSPYFVNAWVDFAAVGGLSIVVCSLSYLLRNNELFTRYLPVPFIPLSFACNYPHYAATYRQLYRSRENIVSYPVTSIVIPFLMIACSYLALTSPETSFALENFDPNLDFE
jgi:hypothetical protein